jgi:hypothetical protein
MLHHLLQLAGGLALALGKLFELDCIVFLICKKRHLFIHAGDRCPPNELVPVSDRWKEGTAVCYDGTKTFADPYQ